MTIDFKSKFARILEASESTIMRMEESLPNYHEDRIAGKGDKTLQHFDLVHKFIPNASRNEDSHSKGSSGQGMGKIGENFGVEPDESQKKKRSDR